MSEHDLQEQLTATWVHQPPKVNGLGELTLLAWEVMFPSWKINDKWTRFGEPAADFIFLTDSSDFVLVEIKAKALTKGTLWKAMCQVSHQAVLFAETYNIGRMISAVSACNAGAKGRVFRSGISPERLKELLVQKNANVSPMRIIRTIAAPGFPKTAESELKAFNSGTHSDIVKFVSEYAQKGMFGRFSKVSPAAFQTISNEPIRLFTLDSKT